MDINFVDYECSSCNANYQLIHGVKLTAICCPFCGSDDIKVIE